MLKIKPCNDNYNDINVIIEIPAYSEPVKYEFDKENNIMKVDRFINVAMQYPCNYGFVPNTLSKDKDPLDVLVITPNPLRHGVLINARVIGMLNMEDESGEDIKIIAVPFNKLTKEYDDILDIDDLSSNLKNKIKHFFEHYKNLEEGKWVKVSGFESKKNACKIIKQSIDDFNNK